jgi:transcriptional antiterminator RfaH
LGRVPLVFAPQKFDALAAAALKAKPMTFWAVAQTVSQRETCVGIRIASEGFEIYAPRIRIHLNGTPRIVALFPSYLFVRIVDRWRIITKTIGVLGLIMAGDHPACCPDAEIEKIKGATMRNGLVKLPKPPKARSFKPGQNVRITSGSFCGFNAIYQGMSPRDREIVLLEMFGRETRLELGAGDIIQSAELPIAGSSHTSY